MVGGSNGSDHLRAAAIDIECRKRSALYVYSTIIEMQLPYRQCILYEGQNFVHVSVNTPGKSYKHEAVIK